MRMDIFAAIAALKVQSKWCVACRMDIFAASAASEVQSRRCMV